MVLAIGARAIPLITRATQTPFGRTLTEGYLSQPVIMVALSSQWLSANGTLDLEGLTLRRGELTQGAWGEGYVDRRHPHAYVHELMVGKRFDSGFLGASLFAGRGYVPFGSDDPMLRPFESFPINHHLAQILERLALVSAARAGPLVGEAALFNGDEPLDPSTPPLLRRFGDSWATRVTLQGERVAPALAGTELSASYAAVRSPEYREGRGLDQRKAHVALRMSGVSSGVSRYALVEWARTSDVDRGRPLYRFTSALAEAAVCGDLAGIALRAEQSDRPEEERLLDPFRSPRPATDLSIVGVTRWTTLTGAFAAPAAHLGAAMLTPFVEVSRISVTRATPTAFDPRLFYGASNSWRFTTGVRVVLGDSHDRMGRYGVATGRTPSAPALTPHIHADQHETRCFP